MDFFKALIPGSVLTFVVTGIIGSNRSKGGWLNIEHIQIGGHSFYWSWALFAVGTGLSWVIFTITPK